MAQPISRAHVAFGAAIRSRRHELRISQEALAAEAGLHRNYVGAVERGERNISLANILVLARTLQVPAGALVGAAERGSA